MSEITAWVLGCIAGFWVPAGFAVVYLKRKGRLQKVADAIRGE